MKRTVLGVLLAALLAVCACACAQELQLGDLVYVPAGVAGGTGNIRLIVEGLTLGEDADTPTVVSPLAGAEFGVYVYSSAGVLTRWANPLFPSEPMRVRTSGTETYFSLPAGTEFYLRQESAPQGYLFDPDALIPVTGEQIVVQNATPGRLIARAQDELGNPISGVRIAFEDADGGVKTAVTDENGEAALRSEGESAYAVREEAIPEGAYSAALARVSDAQGERETQELDGGASVQVAAASRASVTFVHPAPGGVRLSAQLRRVTDDGEEALSPLAGVRLSVNGGESVTTDEDGEAALSLLEGTYDIALSYEGEEDAALPMSGGQLIVRKGEETPVEVTASAGTGRVVIRAQAARAVSGGQVMLRGEADEATYGPYAFDADGLLVSEPLPAGDYRIAAFEAPQETELGQLVLQEQRVSQPEELLLSVRGGEATRVDAALTTWETQTYELLSLTLDDVGQQVYEKLLDEAEFALLDENGSVVGSVPARGGEAVVSALSGAYALRMEEETAQRLGLMPDSRAFDLPSGGGAIVFTGNSARLALYSVDENGMSVPGAVYSVTDGAGQTFTVQTDENGEAVTPPLAPGEAAVETQQSPAEHDAAQTAFVLAQAGEATAVHLAHPSYGEARVSVSLRGLDSVGEARYSPLPGVGIRLYRLSEDGAQMDTGLAPITGEDGVAVMRLKEGEYIAQADAQTLADGVLPPQAVRLSVRNAQQTQAELLCPSALGGLRVELTGGELTPAQLMQARFEAVAADGTVTPLAAQGGAFYAGDLAAGTYVLRQTQIPEGYSLASERTVSVSGGEATRVQVPLEEYAVVTVRKTGLTFDDKLQTFVVPLSGEYAVYTMQDGEMRAYPSEQAQATVWANVTPEQIAQGMAGSVKLPAGIDGRTYYLRETRGAEGFAQDEEYHEVTLYAGQHVELTCAVSSDRGFFSLDQTDAAGAHVSGGAFELLGGDGEVALAFEMGDEPYQNPMALPVGTYTLRQTRAADGCALPGETEHALRIEPYLTQGGNVTHLTTSCVRIPQGVDLALIGDLYAAREQGLTVLSVDGGALAAGETLRMPRLTLDVKGENGERVDVISVVLAGASDAAGNAYAARVEYCLSAGGWQPSDARMTGPLTEPAAISLADVTDDVCAVRVTYLDAETGLEMAGEGFTPGSVSAGIRADGEGAVTLTAQADVEGFFDYRTEAGGANAELERSQKEQIAFDTEGDGAFGAAPAGRDGRISGTAFFDENADGLREANETRGCAGLAVTLVGANGDELDMQTTGEDGSYAFASLPAGTYTVRFHPNETIFFARGEGYSEHVTGAVRTTADGGESEPLTLGGDDTDAVVNAGCVYASALYEFLFADMGGEMEPLVGVNAEARRLDVGEGEEPNVVLSDESGELRFGALMPGRYEVTVTLPEGYISQDAREGKIVREVTLAQGEEKPIIGNGESFFKRAASVSGAVRVDDDGDGVMDERAAGLPNAKVTLVRMSDGHTEQVAQTQTDAHGQYAFDGLYEGEYSVIFELGDEWTFTRYGADSLVFGAMSQTGSTQSFELKTGERAEHIDAGVTIPAQLTVFVFQDAQRDGEFGGREPMLEGASVTLVQLENGEPVRETTYVTDASGAVTFAGVSPGEYRLSYRLPGAWRATVNREPGEYPVSCVPHSALNSGESDVFTLTMGQTGVQLYIGAMLTGSVSGVAYYDDDADAARGEDEAAAEGVQVELLNLEGETVFTTQTGVDGSYAFDGVAPDRYRVRFTSDEDGYFSASERSMARGGVQASDGATATTRMIAVYAGESVNTADAGIVRYAQLGGSVWEDKNADAVRDADETGLAGVKVVLTAGVGRASIAETATGEDGTFAFERVKPGTYTLRIDPPEPYVFSDAGQDSPLSLLEVRDGHGYSTSFELLGGAQAEGISYGAFKQGCVTGRIWDDADYDGVMDEEEAGLRYASVALLDAQGAQVAAAQTGGSGEYTFGSLTPGQYALSVTVPQGYVYTAEGGDSRAPRQDGAQATIQIGEVAMGQTVGGVNAGALVPAKASGTVWFDADDDGLRQNADALVQDVTVRLEMLSGTDAGKVYETKTDALGAYAFAGVMPGQAQLVFELPDGHAFARQPAQAKRGGVVPQTDALTGKSDPFEIAEGADLRGKDVGIVSVGVLSGLVWEDAAYDGERGDDEPGVAGATVSLLDAATGEPIAQAQSGADGSFAIGFVRRGEYVVETALPDGRIYTRGGESAIADVDLPVGHTQPFRLEMGESLSGLRIGTILPASIRGKVQTAEGEGISGALVTLMQGGTAVATAVSGQDGAYVLDTLRPGTYRVRVTLPQDTLFALDTTLVVADSRSQEGETRSMKLDMGQQAELEPFIAVRTGRISGNVWRDDDADGLMGQAEPALGDVTVELIGVQDGKEDTVVRTQTDAGGAYEFTLIRAGTYQVRFTLPEQMLLADRRDEPNGSHVTVVPGNVGTSDAVTLAPGERVTNVNAGGILPGVIGDTVWQDTNGNGLQDYREPRLPDVAISLLRVSDAGEKEEVLSTTSDEYGYYRFGALRPGRYVVKLADKESKLAKHVGDPLGEIDSDLDPKTGESAVLSLRSGQTLLNVDIGLLEE